MQGYRDLAQLLHRELCVIPAPSGQEQLRAAYCADKLRQFGLDAVVDRLYNVTVEWTASEASETVIFAAHTDVVFPDTEPLPLQEDAERIYCPGCGDDTAAVAQLMSVMKMLKDTGRTPRCKVVFALNSCEEGLGNLKGIRAVMARYPDVTAFFTFDGRYTELVDRSVGSHRYRVTVRTEGGHSYNDFGNRNAAEVLARGIGKIYDLPLPQGGKTTYNVGVIEGGTSVNTIVQQASMLCEYRSDVQAHLEYMRERFAHIFDEMAQFADVRVELVGERPSMNGVDTAAQQRLSDFCAEIQYRHVGKAPIRQSGSTDCNIAHSKGIPAVCVGTYMGGGAHTREEWVEKQSVAQGVDIVADVVEAVFAR